MFFVSYLFSRDLGTTAKDLPTSCCFAFSLKDSRVMLTTSPIVLFSTAGKLVRIQKQNQCDFKMRKRWYAVHRRLVWLRKMTVTRRTRPVDSKEKDCTTIIYIYDRWNMTIMLSSYLTLVAVTVVYVICKHLLLARKYLL